MPNEPTVGIHDEGGISPEAAIDGITQMTKVNSEDPYVYNTLDASKSQIRVLILYPSEDPDDPITAGLFTQSLDEIAYTTTPTWKPYSALSYTWGLPVFDGSIILDGKSFPVTISLETALRAMRSRSSDPSLTMSTAFTYSATGATAGPTYWWIDQICINQMDIDERNNQVALMRRVYKRAASVQVWLGPEADESDTAIDLISTLGASPVRQPGEKDIEYPSFNVEEVEEHWQALVCLFRRPWWERVW